MEWELVLKSISVSCICPTGDKAQVRLHGVASLASDSARASDPRSRHPIDSGPCMAALFTKAAYTFERMKFRCGFASQTNGAQEACATVVSLVEDWQIPIDSLCDLTHRRSPATCRARTTFKRDQQFSWYMKKEVLRARGKIYSFNAPEPGTRSCGIYRQTSTPRTNAA